MKTVLITLLLLGQAAAEPAQRADTAGVKAELPTLWIIGDSTVKNSATGQRGWGNEIDPHFDTSRINVVNRARGGRSSRTYQTEGLWDEVLAEMKSGDFVMIQFGHNDGGPLDDPQRARGSIRGIGDESQEIFNPVMNRPETVRTFGWYMSKYIADTRAKGATPIVLSYVPRAPRPGAEPAPPGQPSSYALWAQQVAKREGACFIDLHGRVAQTYSQMNGEKVRVKFFAEDGTHTNRAGAQLNARVVAEAVREMQQCPLAQFLADTSSLRFNLSGQDLEPGEVHVSRDVPYSDDRGHGFEPEDQSLFSVKLPEGNYHVELTFGDTSAASSTTVKAETRRLMLERVETRPGELVTRSFTVNIRSSRLPHDSEVRLKPREIGARHWDHKLTLQFTGERPAVRKIRITPAADAITVYLAGDSTVTDQGEAPWAGWGQILPRFFKPSVAVANHAESGESLRSFRGARRLEKILSQIKPGDWLLIQFGHNDMKEKGEGIGAYTSFKSDLESYVAAAQERGAHVILITPMHRRRFSSDGTIQPTHGDYPDAVRQVAAEQNLPLIDLQAMSKQLYEAMGPEQSKRAFVHYPANTFPNQPEPLKDDTHFNDYGAYQLARCVIEGMRQLNLPLAGHLTDDVGPYDPANPDAAANP